MLSGLRSGDPGILGRLNGYPTDDLCGHPHKSSYQRSASPTVPSLQRTTARREPAASTPRDSVVGVGAWFREITAELRKLLHGAELHTDPGAGHAPHLTNPDDYLAAATAFLSRSRHRALVR